MTYLLVAAIAGWVFIAVCVLAAVRTAGNADAAREREREVLRLERQWRAPSAPGGEDA